jgi:cell shape-determining protein MreC
MINFFSNDKKIIKQQLNMIEYLIADNKRLRNKLDKIQHRQGLQFGGSQLLSKSGTKK